MMYAAILVAVLTLIHLHLGSAVFGVVLGVLAALVLLYVFWRIIND